MANDSQPNTTSDPRRLLALGAAVIVIALAIALWILRGGDDDSELISLSLPRAESAEGAEPVSVSLPESARDLRLVLDVQPSDESASLVDWQVEVLRDSESVWREGGTWSGDARAVEIRVPAARLRGTPTRYRVVLRGSRKRRPMVELGHYAFVLE